MKCVSTRKTEVMVSRLSAALRKTTTLALLDLNCPQKKERKKISLMWPAGCVVFGANLGRSHLYIMALEGRSKIGANNMD